MKLTERQLTAYEEFFAILANIHQRCSMEGLNVNKKANPPLPRTNERQSPD
jgi:hypothetical protein